MMIENKEKYLKAELASLLSFDLEDIQDVFEPLLEFESEDDLLEYISALTGKVTEQGKAFAKNMIRFQKGLDLVVVAADSDTTITTTANNNNKEKIEKKSSSGGGGGDGTNSMDVRQNITNDSGKDTNIPQGRFSQQRNSSSSSSSLNKATTIEHTKGKNVEQKDQNKKQTIKPLLVKEQGNENNSNVDLVKAIGNLKVSELKTTTTTTTKKPTTAPKQVEPKKVPAATKPPPPPPSPKKGKAKIICGCFGTIHKPLTNCLHCGRISCEKEGYDYCPFCSFLIEKVKIVSIPGEEFNKAVMHKERLLQFDRENASRTVVYDDQADYFQNSLCTWLTEDERNDALSKEERRRRDLHSVKKHVLNIQF